ncbi:MAG TPA: transketolase C-terminal domain-containing protein [Streptosporangiaceae bacterium]|nr:transketolase C-terminal domain-containing protein [Streptosporangiaceae bacterium]
MTAADPAPALYDCRDAYAATIEEIAAADERVVVVCSDSVGSSKLVGFKRRFPERLVNVGIAEQAMVGIAAGLANGGKLPFVSAASCFLTARGLEQLKVDLAYTNANVTVCGMSPGVAYGELGPTHHSIEDIAWLRAIDNLVILVPADPLETAQALRAAAGHEGPVFVRVSRMAVPAVHEPGYEFRIGRASRLTEGRDVTVIANGTMVSRALEAARLLAADGIAARVLAMPTVRPLDLDEVAAAVEETGAIVTVEEHSVRGGLGGAVAEAVVAMRPVPVRILGFPGFAPTGSASWLLSRFRLTGEGVREAALDVLARKQP